MDPRERERRRTRRVERKDRLIQARVAEDLEQTLKREAARRRLTVSHLIRNTLEDAFTLVEDVTADVGQLVSGSVELAAAVGRDARRFASMVRGADVPTRAEREGDPERVARASDVVPAAVGRESEPPGELDGSHAEAVLSRVYGWNRVIANRSASCGQCGASIARGEDALVGLSDEPGPRVWLCGGCAERL